MKRPRTASQLFERLDDEFSWRFQEITLLRKAIKQSKGKAQDAILRASVPILYAHWEGFIKSAASLYSDFICKLGLRYKDVKDSFSGVRALAYVKQLHEINKSIFTASELLAALHGIAFDKVNISMRDHISDIGNLNSDLLNQIAKFLALDVNAYILKKQLIDESLVKQRNEIAHGEYLIIDVDGFENLADEVVTLMRMFKTDIQNAAVSRDICAKWKMPRLRSMVELQRYDRS